MKLYTIGITALLVIGFSCKSQPQTRTIPAITIHGYIPHFKGDSVYIAQANYFDKPLCWAKVENGRFTFVIKDLAIDKEPFFASLGYLNDTGSLKLYYFKNEILSPQETKYLISAFYIDTPHIQINEDAAGPHNLTVQAGQETKARYQIQMMEFGALDIDPVKRTEQLETYKAIIKKYPQSFCLLSKLNENKVLAKKVELESMLACFEPSFLAKHTGQYFKDYLAKKEDAPVFERITLEDANAVPISMIDTTASINMLVFWASWCSPCRREIPDLKELYNSYSKKGLVITSISIDDNKTSWQTALSQEKMPWQQLIVPAGKKQQVNIAYEVGAVPYTIFTNSKGKLIERFIGIDEKAIETYKRLIEKQLK